MKLFVDDLRSPPDNSWTVAKTAMEAIDILFGKEVTEVSLDHDLGDTNYPEQTGYTVLVWIEVAVARGYLSEVPIIGIHTANPVGRKKMELALKRIHSLKNAPNTKKGKL